MKTRLEPYFPLSSAISQIVNQEMKAVDYPLDKPAEMQFPCSENVVRNNRAKSSKYLLTSLTVMIRSWLIDWSVMTRKQAKYVETDED